MGLAEQQCVPCRDEDYALNHDQAQERLAELPEWEIREYEGAERLVRTFKFKAYGDGLQFTLKVGELADAADHHPTIITAWGQVTVHWWTHAINGLHQNDFIMAARTDEAYREFQ